MEDVEELVLIASFLQPLFQLRCYRRGDDSRSCRSARGPTVVDPNEVIMCNSIEQERRVAVCTYAVKCDTLRPSLIFRFVLAVICCASPHHSKHVALRSVRFCLEHTAFTRRTGALAIEHLLLASARAGDRLDPKILAEMPSGLRSQELARLMKEDPAGWEGLLG